LTSESSRVELGKVSVKFDEEQTLSPTNKDLRKFSGPSGGASFVISKLNIQEKSMFSVINETGDYTIEGKELRQQMD